MLGNKEIFSVSVYGQMQAWTTQALGRVKDFSPALLRNPAIAGEIEKVIEGFKVQIPDLRPNDKSGKRRIERTSRSERTVIDVTIPTNGDAQTLRLQPSNSPIFQIPVSLTREGVVLTLEDDDRLDDQVNDFVARAVPTIELLKREVAAHLPGIRQAVESAAQERLAALKAQDERDQRRGFPIA